MWVHSKRRLYSQMDDAAQRFDVQLVCVRYTEVPRLIWGVDATFQQKYARHNIPHPAYFRFRRVHPCFYRKTKIGNNMFMDKYAGRNKVKR